MKKVALILMVIILLCGCAKVPAPVDSIDEPEIVGSIGEPKTPSGPVVVSGNFEEDLMNAMPDDVNVIISPYSIRMALMLAANGATGDTQKEILDTLGVTDLDGYNELARKTIQDANNTGDLKLNISNSIWFNTDRAPVPGIKFADTYKDKVAEYFGATADEVTDADAVETINGWIEEKTEGKIKDVLSNPEFNAALVNAIYFKGEWKNQFSEHSTKKKSFKDAAGSSADIDFMKQTESFGYYEDDNFQMIEMGYKGKDVSMYVFLPQEGKTVTQADMNKAIAQKKMEEVEVSIPKFKMEFGIKLKDILEALGIEKAFNPDTAELRDMFENMPESINAWVEQVIHKAFIEIDENGTEAAAATVVIMEMTTSLPEEKPKPKVFTADHPFSYVIRDNTSGEIYFSGHFSYAE